MNDSFKGVAFKRGHIIQEWDTEHMLRIGKQHILVWEEHAGEVHEDDCARRMAAMALVEGAHYTEPAEGKVLLSADQIRSSKLNGCVGKKSSWICCPRYFPGTKSAMMNAHY